MHADTVNRSQDNPDYYDMHDKLFCNYKDFIVSSSCTDAVDRAQDIPDN